MTALFAEYLIKLTLVLMLPVAFAVTSRAWSADFRARCTVAVLAIALVLPAIIALAPEHEVWTYRLAPAEPAATSAQLSIAAVTEATTRIDAQFSVGWILAFIYAAVAALLLAATSYKLCLAFRHTGRLPQCTDPVSLRLLESLASEMGLTRAVDLRENPARGSPYAFGVRRPVIVLPADFATWSYAKQRAAMIHEIAHIQRHDVVLAIFVRIALTVLWFHPLVWYAIARFKKDIEQASDDVALELGAVDHDYARYLIDTARQQDLVPPGPAVPMAAGRALRERIGALMNKRQRRQPMSSTHLRWLAATTIALTYALGAAQVGAVQPDDRRYMPIFKFVPDYPATAEEQKIEGYVVVEFDLDESGKPYNVRAVEQSPDDGTFEASALAAAERFRYLPERVDGVDVIKHGIRNRLNYALGEPQPAIDDEDSLEGLRQVNSRTKGRLTSKLYADIAVAEAAEDGDALAQLAAIALEVEPATAEYLVVRASQIGTSNTDGLRVLTGQILHQRGSHEQAIRVFEQVSDADLDQLEIARRWIQYVKREVVRRDVIHEALLDLSDDQ